MVKGQDIIQGRGLRISGLEGNGGRVEVGMSHSETNVAGLKDFDVA